MNVSKIASTTAGLVAGLAFITPARAAPQGSPEAPPDDPRMAGLMQEVSDLKAEVRELRDRLDQVAPIARTATAPPSPSAPAAGPQPAVRIASALGAPPPAPPSPAAAAQAGDKTAVAQATPPPQAPAAPAAQAPKGSGELIADALKGMTLNVALDTYYEYNFNRPTGRVNLLRAYDITSNSFSLNQADVVLESATDLDHGKRWGLRLDLQYGQATATLQGNPANELRPDVYRNVYQAYGTYIVPLGSGLILDFGKWSSSLGIEGNYTKDQLNYSRSFWFDFLPFYHEGVRAKYQINSLIGANFWVTNGVQQTEANNNYKDQLYGLVLTPNPALSLTLNYYHGQEHPDVTYLQNPTPAQMDLPNQQGTYILPITDPPTGLLNIGDAYFSWQASPKLTVAGEGDYVEERLYSSSPQQIVWGGAAYAAYQITPQLSVAARGEFLADRNGLYSGVGQKLEELTLTIGYQPLDGFLLRGEFRQDFSSRPFFYGNALGRFMFNQPTLGFGAVWWFGQKQGAW